MALEAVKRPYEFLVRWDRDGKLSGSHVQWRTVVTENGQYAGETVSAADPVGMTPGAAGFPLADILGQMTIDALTAVNQLTERIAKTEPAHPIDDISQD